MGFAYLLASTAHRRGMRECVPHRSLHDCKAEVRELGGSFLVHEYVLTLDITMGDPVLMQEQQTLSERAAGDTWRYAQSGQTCHTFRQDDWVGQQHQSADSAKEVKVSL